ncbi:DUF6119 family protein [Pseudovibrio sp. Ad26]|uniref:DUF6119 family protein n=1 Tax=Pseudovibrio sp. Ad26 TaxID=989410 RepID=UPI0007AE5136|nr:DUF6119 family protein [Pseudovibrio sp. Ad26]KZK97215.1 hypothetical protein PsAD26_05620 [Pseudovibrio sp. Ad26]
MTDSSIMPTVYLIKPQFTEPKDIFKDSDELKIQNLEPEGEDPIHCMLFFKESVKRSPKWLPFIAMDFDVNALQIFNSSSYAVLVINTAERLFVIPFGMGLHLIDLTKIEYNFGLKVAINSIPQNDLKQINLTTPEASSQKTLRQAPKNSSPTEMGINQQKDILRGLAGDLPKNHSLGKRIEGKDSVRPTKKIETYNELQKLCAELLNYSEKTDYQAKFPWIDNMSLTNDPITIERLFDELLLSMRTKNFENMYIGNPPGI